MSVSSTCEKINIIVEITAKIEKYFFVNNYFYNTYIRMWVESAIHRYFRIVEENCFYFHIVNYTNGLFSL